MKKSIQFILLFLSILVISLVTFSVAGPDLARASAGLVSSAESGLLALPQQTPESDKLVLGGSYILDEGETLNGSLYVLGGTARLAAGSSVRRDVVVMGGTLTADGNVGGDINAIGGLVAVGASAHVAGDINTVSAQVERDEGARVDGKLNNLVAGPFSIIVPGSFQLPAFEGVPPISLPKDLSTPKVDVQLNPLWEFLWWLIRSFIWAAIAVLVALFMPAQVSRTAKAAVDAPFASGGMGCLTLLVAPLIVVLLIITICGIPIALIGALMLWFAWGLGVIALGAETGRRLAGILKVDWAVPVAAGVGTFILTLVSNGIGLLIPCVGWLVPLMIGLVGLGAAFLTRYGAHPHPPGPAHHERAQPEALSTELPPPEEGDSERPTFLDA